MNFKEPVTTFAYNLISLHHDIMWYLIIILSIVYWVLFKILKDYSWNSYNKLEGFLLHGFYKKNRFYKIQKFILYLWITVFIYNINYFNVKINFWIASKLDANFKNQKVGLNHNLFFLIGRNYYKNLNYDYLEHLAHLGWDQYNLIIYERFFAYYFFNKTNNAIYFYDGNDSVLKALNFKHSMKLEYIFGLFPTLIIGFIIVPSMYLLYSNETDINPAMTIKVVGHQWYWSYESNFSFVNNTKNKEELINVKYNFESIMVDDNDLVLGKRRLLETYNALVLPYNVVIRFLITSSDVLHSWALPEFGIKVDAVPGRLNQVVTTPSNLGVFYGQCSEICGVSHGFMPIKINVISLTDYHGLLSV